MLSTRSGRRATLIALVVACAIGMPGADAHADVQLYVQGPDGRPVPARTNALAAAPAFLDAPGSIAGVVTDAASGVPLAGLQVLALTPAGNPVGGSSTSASGAYSIPVPAGTYYVHTQNSAGYVDEWWNDIPYFVYQGVTPPGGLVAVGAGATASGVDFALAAGGRIAGAVRATATGSGLASVQVDVVDASQRQLVLSVTNAAGDYVTGPGLPAGTYYVRTHNHSGYVDEIHDGVACVGWTRCAMTGAAAVSVSPGAVTSVDFTLEAGGLMSGTVTAAATGTTLAGVGVWIHDATGQYVTDGTTDASGAYLSASGLTAGSYRARTRNAVGYVDELYDNVPCPGGTCNTAAGTPIAVALGATTAGIDFALSQGGWISGSVTDASGGAPLAGVTVSFFTPAGAYAGGATTGAAGLYTSWSVLAPGSYYARTNNSLGYVDEQYDDVPCPGNTCGFTAGTPVVVAAGATTSGIAFALAMGGRFSGTVVSAVTGVPLANVSVNVFDASGSSIGYAVTNSVGQFLTPTGLPSGSYYARTSNGQGYLDELYDNVPCPGASCSLADGTPIGVALGATTAGIDFALSPGGRIAGTVTDASSGSPLAGVSVSFWDASDPWGSPVTSAVTDAAGAYVAASGLSVGTYYVTTSNTLGYVDELYDDVPCPGAYCSFTPGAPVTVSAGATTSGIDFALMRGGRITGKVTNAATGAPLGGLWLTFYQASGGYVGEVYTDALGTYASPGLPAGTYFAMTYNELGYVDELYDDIPCPGGYCDPMGGTPIILTTGATAGIDFALSVGGKISGTVTDAVTGAALTGVWVRVYDSTGRQIASQWIGSAGPYTTATGLPAGTYFVRTYNSKGYVDLLYDGISCAGGDCTVTAGTPVVVTAGATTPGVSFALPAGGRVSGTVTAAPTGAPLASVGVYVYSPSGKFLTNGWTDSSGRYTTATGLTAGSYYAVTSNSAGYVDLLYGATVPCPSGVCGLTRGTPIAVVLGATTSGIDFALSPGGRIGGTVTIAATGAAVRPGQIQVLDASGTLVGVASTGMTGGYATTPLPAGTYFVRTSATGYVDELYDDVPCPRGACTLASGSTVAVVVGATTPSIDFALARSSARDIDADGRSDIVWRHTGGALYVWQMGGTTLTASSYLPPISLAWTIRGMGDFNADGTSDLLWRESTSGATYLWLMDGATAIGSGYTSSLADTTWTIQGTGDFDGDGKSDILWRHSGGAMYVWLMDGVTLKPTSAFLPPISLQWKIEATGDFNGDARADILWRDSVSGATYVWLMDGATAIGSGYTASYADNSWAIQGVGDLDADGRSDIVWRHTGGALYVWQMNGTALKASSYLPPISLSWTIQQMGDFNGDGRTDFLWREQASGNTYVWLMDGATAIGADYTEAQADNSWVIQAP